MPAIKELIEAFTIFGKYTSADEVSVTTCEHDILYVCVDPNGVTVEDRKRLYEIGFHAENEQDRRVDRDAVPAEEGHEQCLGDNFYSYRHGSC